MDITIIEIHTKHYSVFNSHCPEHVNCHDDEEQIRIRIKIDIFKTRVRDVVLN